MGKIKTILYDELIDETPDRNANRVRLYEAPNGEVTLHFRNLKVVLHTPEEINEWKHGFQTALQKLDETSGSKRLV